MKDYLQVPLTPAAPRGYTDQPASDPATLLVDSIAHIYTICHSVGSSLRTAEFECPN